jgi:hypothetical protein
MDARATGDAFNPQQGISELQTMKFIYFFLFLWVNADLDPENQIIADPCGSGSETLDESGKCISEVIYSIRIRFRV